MVFIMELTRTGAAGGADVGGALVNTEVIVELDVAFTIQVNGTPVTLVPRATVWHSGSLNGGHFTFLSMAITSTTTGCTAAPSAYANTLILGQLMSFLNARLSARDFVVSKIAKQVLVYLVPRTIINREL